MGLTVVNGRPAPVKGEQTVLREAISAVTRAIEDIGWQDLSMDRAMNDGITYEERRALIERSRTYVRKNPLGKQAASLLVNYVLGKGLTLTARNRTLVARIVDEFWGDQTNKAAFTGHQAMSDFLVGAFSDGMQCLILFPDPDTGTVTLGYLDAMYVEDIISDPENARVPLWVKVRKPRTGYDFRNGVYVPSTTDDFVWYRHWRNVPEDDEEQQQDSPAKDLKPKRKRLSEAEKRERAESSIRRGPGKVEPGLIYISKRGRGKFGYPETAPALDWMAAHKNFMEDRATLSRAAAAVAWRKKRKNSTATDVATEVARLRSSLSNVGTTPGFDSNPPSAAGSTLVENENTTMEWVKTDTGGQNALADERILRMMVGAGLGGIPSHLFGDAADANLATATAMNTPLHKSYENWQQWLGDIISDLVTFALETAHKAGRIGPRDNSLRYAERKLSTEKVQSPGAPPPGMPSAGKPPSRGFGQAPPPGGARYPSGTPSPIGESDAPVRRGVKPVRVAPRSIADAPELQSPEAFWAAGNINPKAAPARAARDFDALPQDAYIWVYHATKEPTGPFLNEGLRPENAPANIAKEFNSRQPKEPMLDPTGQPMVGPDGMPVPSPEPETPEWKGTSVTGTLALAQRFGPNVLAMRVRVGDLRLRPESEKSNLTVGEVLVGQDGAIVERVSPFDMVEVKGKDAYRAIKQAVARDSRLKEADDDHFYGAWSGGSKASGGGPGRAATIEQRRAEVAARVGQENVKATNTDADAKMKAGDEAFRSAVEGWLEKPPWTYSDEDIKAGKVPGVEYKPSLGSGTSAGFGGQVAGFANYGGSPHITVTDAFFSLSPSARSLLFFHEAGHRATGGPESLAAIRKGLEPYRTGQDEWVIPYTQTRLGGGRINAHSLIEDVADKYGAAMLYGTRHHEGNEGILPKLVLEQAKAAGFPTVGFRAERNGTYPNQTITFTRDRGGD